MTILEELIRLKKEEEWERYLKSNEEIGEHFIKLEQSGRLMVCSEKEKLIGYCEYTRLNPEQLGNVVLTGEIAMNAFDANGNIAFITNLHVCERYRGLGAIRYFKNEILNRNPNVLYICGQHQGKNLKPFAVFKRRLHGN